MNLQDRIVEILNDYCSSAFESDRALAAKAILALVEGELSALKDR